MLIREHQIYQILYDDLQFFLPFLVSLTPSTSFLKFCLNWTIFLLQTFIFFRKFFKIKLFFNMWSMKLFRFLLVRKLSFSFCFQNPSKLVSTFFFKEELIIVIMKDYFLMFIKFQILFFLLIWQLFNLKGHKVIREKTITNIDLPRFLLNVTLDLFWWQLKPQSSQRKTRAVWFQFHEIRTRKTSNKLRRNREQKLANLIRIATV